MSAKALYERLAELEIDQCRRGQTIDLSDSKPHHLGLSDPARISVEHEADGTLLFSAADEYGVCLSIRMPAAKAIELGWRDPENFWRREWERVVLSGPTQKDRDAVYRGLTGAKESNIWNALERAFGNDVAERVRNRPVLETR